MALKTFVKVSGVNNLSDARYCAGMGVDQIGFNIEENHSNYTDKQSFKEISDWLSGVEFVGEIEDVATSATELASEYGIEVVQISNKEQIASAVEAGLKVIFKTSDISVCEDVLNTYSESLQYVLFELDSSASLSVKDGQKDHLVIQGGFNADNIESFIDEHHIKGVALQGGNEIRPGYKDFDELADILEILEDDEWA